MIRNNDLDLIVGETVGNLNFIENIGDSLNFSFDLNSETFGGVNVSQWWTNIGSSNPFFTNENNELVLYVGSERGTIFKYNNITNNLNGNFNLLDSSYQDINLGPNSSLAIADLNNDSMPDFIIGNKRGGLSLFKGISDTTATYINKYEIEKKFKIYPNPVKNILNINIQEPNLYTIYNITGQKVQTVYCKSLINVSKLENGVYFLVFKYGGKPFVMKFIK